MPRIVLAVSVLLLFLPACRRPGDGGGALPGEAIGQYSVRGTLVENQCGEGYPAPGELFFHVELRETPGSAIGYWKLPDDPISQGTLQRGAFRFEDRQQVIAIPAEPDLGVPGCALERLETVSGTLHGVAGDGGAQAMGDAGPGDDGGSSDADAGPPPGRDAFVGTTTVRVSPVPGGDCTALLATWGGPFPTMPCEIRFSLSGDRLEEDLW